MLWDSKDHRLKLQGVQIYLNDINYKIKPPPQSPCYTDSELIRQNHRLKLILVCTLITIPHCNLVFSITCLINDLFLIYVLMMKELIGFNYRKIIIIEICIF